jgi:group I intron endonuclease
MVGIYKITNNVNGKCYIGQSVKIKKRWNNHRASSSNKNDRAYEYPLYRSIRKYGLDKFSFEILEKCCGKILNEREVYWINKISPEYNQTCGGDYLISPVKLTLTEVEEIQKILIKDIESEVYHCNIAEKYGVHKDTIRDINVGRTWNNPKLKYPLHYSKFTGKNISHSRITYCIDCGNEISKYSKRCNNCNFKFRVEISTNLSDRISREELKNYIRTRPFTWIGNKFNVSDNTIRRWCDSFNLPRKKSDITKIDNKEWVKI